MDVLITGGTGTLGQELTKQLLSNDNVGRIVVYSRNEYSQAKMRSKYPEGGPTGVRYVIGDVCNKTRLKYALEGIDTVIHAAAMKRIETCEYNIFDCIAVNVIGSSNVVQACIETGVSQCILVSTDKACSPVTAYGASKSIAERLFISANNFGRTTFCCARYGNVIGSHGSVHEIWERRAIEKETLFVTNRDMTRFFWGVDEAAKFVIDRLQSPERGVIYVPEINSKKMIDIARGFSEDIEIVGMKTPEKIHEEMISETEAYTTYRMSGYYTIYPVSHDWCLEQQTRGEKVHLGFRLSSLDLQGT